MQTHANLVLRTAQTRDHTTAVDILTDAFHDAAIPHWIEPDPARRAHQLRTHLAALLEHAAVHGTIRLAQTDTTPVGAAVWFPYPLDPGATDVHNLTPTDGPQFTDSALRLSRLTHALKARHPTARPHHYLAALGVCTHHQNRGAGTALITDHHVGLDYLRTPAYLEAHDLRHRALYQRLGYTDHGKPITVDGGPPVQPMWYQPAPSTA